MADIGATRTRLVIHREPLAEPAQGPSDWSGPYLAEVTEVFKPRPGDGLPAWQQVEVRQVGDGDPIGAANLAAARWAADHGLAWHGLPEDGSPWATIDEHREIMRWSGVVIDLDGREVVVTDCEEDGITRGHGWTVIVDGEATHGADVFSEAGIREALDAAYSSREWSTRLFTTRDDAIAAIAAAIEGSGVIEDAEAAYDLDAIADEVLVWDDGYDAEDDVNWLDRQGWRLIQEAAEFWRVVERHEREGGE